MTNPPQDRQKHRFVRTTEPRETGARYRCEWCGWGTNFPEMYDTDQSWREQPDASPLRIVGGFHGCQEGAQKISPIP